MAALPRSRKLLCSGREETHRQEETQVRHRFVVPTLVSPTPGETKKWGSLSLCRFRKRWASPPSRNTQVPDNPLYPCHSEGLHARGICFRAESRPRSRCHASRYTSCFCRTLPPGVKCRLLFVRPITSNGMMYHVSIGIKYTAKKSSTPHGYFSRFGPSTFKLNDPPRR